MTDLNAQTGDSYEDSYLDDLSGLRNFFTDWKAREDGARAICESMKGFRRACLRNRDRGYLTVLRTMLGTPPYADPLFQTVNFMVTSCFHIYDMKRETLTGKGYGKRSMPRPRLIKRIRYHFLGAAACTKKFFKVHAKLKPEEWSEPLKKFQATIEEFNNKITINDLDEGARNAMIAYNSRLKDPNEQSKHPNVNEMREIALSFQIRYGVWVILGPKYMSKSFPYYC